MFKVPEKYRVTSGAGRYSTAPNSGNSGLFFIPIRKGRTPLKIIASEGYGWEHVSVSLTNRSPTWEEMCLVKSLFWDRTDLVIQYHPPEETYVNHHNYCLHLWRKEGTNDFCEVPPTNMV